MAVWPRSTSRGALHEGNKTTTSARAPGRTRWLGVVPGSHPAAGAGGFATGAGEEEGRCAQAAATEDVGRPRSALASTGQAGGRDQELVSINDGEGRQGRSEYRRRRRRTTENLRRVLCVSETQRSCIPSVRHRGRHRLRRADRGESPAKAQTVGRTRRGHQSVQPTRQAPPCTANRKRADSHRLVLRSEWGRV